MCAPSRFFPLIFFFWFRFTIDLICTFVDSTILHGWWCMSHYAHAALYCRLSPWTFTCSFRNVFSFIRFWTTVYHCSYAFVDKFCACFNRNTFDVKQWNWHIVNCYLKTVNACRLAILFSFVVVVVAHSLELSRWIYLCSRACHPLVQTNHPPPSSIEKWYAMHSTKVSQWKSQREFGVSACVCLMHARYTFAPWFSVMFAQHENASITPAHIWSTTETNIRVPVVSYAANYY